MNGKSIEELKNEAAAAAEALRIAEAEAARIEREKAEEERRAKYRAVAEAREKAVAAVKDDMILRLERSGVATSEAKRLISVYSRTQGRFPRLGAPEKIFIEVDGLIGERAVIFPPKADGTYSYAKIISAVIERIATWKALQIEKAQKEARRATGAAIVEKIKSEFAGAPVTTSYGVHLPTGTSRTEWREYVAPEGHVYLQLGNLTVTEEQARIMLEAYARAFQK